MWCVNTARKVRKVVTIVGVLELQCWDGIRSDFPLSLGRLGSICQEYPAPAHHSNKESINLWLKLLADEVQPDRRAGPRISSVSCPPCLSSPYNLSPEVVMRIYSRQARSSSTQLHTAPDPPVLLGNIVIQHSSVCHSELCLIVNMVITMCLFNGFGNLPWFWIYVK